MIEARFGGDADLGAEKGGTKLSDQFFHRVSAVAKALSKLAIAALFVRGPVGLMPISA